MQVVYLGSSPATQRRQYGSPRLMRPTIWGGSLAQSTRPGSALLQGQRSIDSHTSCTAQTSSSQKLTETVLKDSIPALPKSVAILCLLLNIISPGFGTFVSACSVFCCGIVRPRDASKYRVFFINVGVSLLQLFTAFIFLLGWIWSIMWGAAFLEISNNFYKQNASGEEANKSMSNNRIVERPNDLKLKTKNNNIRALKNDLGTDSPTIVLHGVPMVVTQETSNVDGEKQHLVSEGAVTVSADNCSHTRFLKDNENKEIDALFVA